MAIARALANRPTLLLADEPTGALDSEGAAGVLDLFRRLHRAGQGTRRYGADLRVVTDAAHPDRGAAQLLAIEPWRSTGMGALCIDPGPVGEAVRIGHASAVAALDAAGG
ncbi:hypothetical protein ACVGVM_22855 [Pseudonocardia bannensis]|uniref:hypothetical protein n=1 Tax=Pseudonocardia bannensis TaxID=630973 RepID=UPI0028AFF93B|nr:hypothetical protein [Pseudonocardia bannensis]